MATSTVPRSTTAPTEAEIREAIRLRCELWPTDDPRKPLREAIESFGDFMHSPAYDVLASPDEPPTEVAVALSADVVWVDLRPSEARDLERLYREAADRAVADAEAVAIDAFAAAAVRFVELHPDAPRARVSTG